MTFRTATGQTGKDAYVYTATAIANAQRELDREFTRLLEAAHAEHPELFEHSTDFHPGWLRAVEAGHFADYLMYGGEEAARRNRR